MLAQQILAWAWLFPLPGLLIAILAPAGRQRRAGWASVPGPVVLLLVAVWALLGMGQGGAFAIDYPGWLPFLPDGHFRLLVDGLSAVLLAVLGFVAALVYIYSIGYMADDPGRERFFGFLDLFVASMAFLLLAGNLALLLIGWTGVGVSSFLLISFWRDRKGTLGAGLQALAANAIGDGALLLAAVLVPTGCGALVTLGTAQCTGGVGGATLLAGLIVIAAAAKSAQGPLYFWLPSAMAGPTPISALIHAATMVAAGVYLLARTHVLLDHAPAIALTVAVVGGATAVLASLASLAQSNFKRGIAYSTVAQLGYMFAAAGVGAPFAAVFHLVTHAGFKALLFLSAGVVIHGSGGEERLARLSGRGRAFPVSYVGFLVGSLALIGTPLLSGSFSKDSIISAATSRLPVLGYVLLASVVLTGLYIGRLFFRVYHGAPLAGEVAPHATAHHGAAERLMNLALMPLIGAAILAGYLAFPTDWLQSVLRATLGPGESLTLTSPPGLIAFALGLAGFGVSWFLSRKAPDRLPVTAAAAPWAAAGWVQAIASGANSVSSGLAKIQSGRLARYAFGSLLAVASILLVRVVAR